MTNFICTVEQINQMLSIVNSIPLPTTKLEVFNNGIKFAFETNIDDWFQLVQCVDGTVDLQAAYENKDGIQIVLIDNSIPDKMLDILKHYIPGVCEVMELDEQDKAMQAAIASGRYVITETEDNMILVITE